MMRRCAPVSLGLGLTTGFPAIAVSATRAASSFSSNQAPNAFNRLRVSTWSASSSSSCTGGAATTSKFQRRNFLFRARNNEPPKVAVDEANFDKQHSHWNGQLFGIPMDKVIYYLKINGGIATLCLMVYMFFKGYIWMSGFSLASVGRMGFAAGFWTSFTLYSMALLVKRNYQIAPNAVYNQAIAIVLKDQRVIDHLGNAPRTGDFRAFCASGGFKLPLLRRLRSGQYSLSDALGTKPRKLQMMFLLSSTTGGQEALVSCEVRKGTSGMLSSNYYFQSLHLHLTAPKQDAKNLILIGGEKDVVFKGMLSSAMGKSNQGK